MFLSWILVQKRKIWCKCVLKIVRDRTWLWKVQDSVIVYQDLQRTARGSVWVFVEMDSGTATNVHTAILEHTFGKIWGSASHAHPNVNFVKIITHVPNARMDFIEHRMAYVRRSVEMEESLIFNVMMEMSLIMMAAPPPAKYRKDLLAQEDLPKTKIVVGGLASLWKEYHNSWQFHPFCLTISWTRILKRGTLSSSYKRW